MNKKKIFSLGGRFAGAFPIKKLRTVRPMFLYMVAYLVSFGLIEQWNRLHYTVIHTVVDDMIPFSPVFVIPYILWFPYVLGTSHRDDCFHRRFHHFSQHSSASS